MWTPPNSVGSSPFVEYLVSGVPGGPIKSPVNTLMVPGLTNGSTYHLSIVTVNRSGVSAPVTLDAMPYTTPSPPLGLVATPADQQVTLTWIQPVDSGGSTISGYSVMSGGDLVCSTTITSCVVSGLQNGTSYNFAVTAHNQAGDSAPATVTSTPRTTPSAPTSLSPSPGNQHVDVSWQPPLSDGGAPVLYYVITDGGGETCRATAVLSCTLSPLTNGAPVTITVVAYNAAGSSPPATVTTVPSTVPSVPLNFAVASGLDQSASATWSAPLSDGGAPVFNYNITATPASGGPGTTTSCAPPESPTLGCTVANLTNGTQYNFQIEAINVAGASDPSSTVSAVPFTFPSPPTGVTASAPLLYSSSAPGQLVVTWSPPVSNGGSPILSYTATESDSSNPSCTYVVATPETDTCTITNPRNQDTVSVTVVATNAAGQSIDSTPVGPIAPVWFPNPPTGVATTPGNGQIAVSWTASDPATPVGPTPPTSYTATAYAPDSTPAGTCTYVVSVPETDTCTISGLTNFVAYSVKVVASTPYLSSSPAVGSAPTIPFAVPSAPQNVTVTDLAGSSTVSWDAPVDAGGASLLGYSITATDTTNPASPGASCNTLIAAPGASESCPLIFSGSLPNPYGDTYAVSVVATNDLGSGVGGPGPAAITSFRDFVPPAAPVITGATSPQSGELDVSFTPSGGRNDDSIAQDAFGQFAITATDVSNSSQPVAQCFGTWSNRTCPLTGLAVGDLYSITATVSNAAGTSPASAPYSQTVQGSSLTAPRQVNVLAYGGAFTVQWYDTGTWPGPTVAVKATAHDLTKSAADLTCTTPGPTAFFWGTNQDTCTIFGVTIGDHYSVTVGDVVGSTNGPASSPVTAVGA